MTEANLPRHELVPLHEKLSSEEKSKVFISIGVDFRHIPKIHMDDPAIRNIADVKPGDIIKITRKSSTAGQTVFYRGVVDA